MSETIRTAVVLAAGRGTRLGARGVVRPKGFLRLGERPIVEESLLRLRAAGIERVVIVTGHCAEHYERLRARHVELVETVHNERYADSGSMHSLACARERLDGPFLLLESDLVYEDRALAELLAHPAEDAILVSTFTNTHDEVFIEVDADGALVDMSKDRARLGTNVIGELVGITKVSRALLDTMLDVSAPRFRETLFVDYETDALVGAARVRPIPCHLVDGLAWAEIDDEPALERARRDVYPRIAVIRADA